MAAGKSLDHRGHRVAQGKSWRRYGLVLGSPVAPGMDLRMICSGRGLTTGWFPGSIRFRESRCFRTICILTTRCRTCGLRRTFERQRSPEISTWQGSRCREFHSSSSATTSGSAGDSPILGRRWKTITSRNSTRRGSTRLRRDGAMPSTGGKQSTSRASRTWFWMW